MDSRLRGNDDSGDARLNNVIPAKAGIHFLCLNQGIRSSVPPVIIMEPEQNGEL
jgi:hypothetical protein